ncbi:MAG: tripartite tricarboxylate transporter TctB family protein [Rhodospirillales bacterium]
MSTEARKDTGGAIVAAILIGVACLVLWDTTSYVDSDSAVFPRTFSGVLITASAAYIVVWLFGRGEQLSITESGSTIRRLLLITIMIAGTLAMPWIGFIPASLPVFAALTLVAMYDPWTKFRLIVYPIIGTAIVLGFYYLFSKALLVPLPTAELF